MMNYPAFFDRLPVIRLRDPLARFLGVNDDGVLDYRYLDAVRLAGHSCPTVAAAWNMSRLALAALYGDELPCRGAIRVDLAKAGDEGVTGVIASVVTLLTGAAGDGGFKGIAGQFRRSNLLAFGVEMPLELRLTRLDDGRSVDVACDTSRIPADPGMPELLRQCLSGQADETARQLFGSLWQERVRCLLEDFADDPQVFIVRSSR
jgi:hypothetical protein